MGVRRQGIAMQPAGRTKFSGKAVGRRITALTCENQPQGVQMSPQEAMKASSMFRSSSACVDLTTIERTPRAR